MMPSEVPTPQPSMRPTFTGETYPPTQDPTTMPSEVPTPQPSMRPTFTGETYPPTLEPSQQSTQKPSPEPSMRPTVSGETYPPTEKHTSSPSSTTPSIFPSGLPSSEPSISPTSSPAASVTTDAYVVYGYGSRCEKAGRLAPFERRLFSPNIQAIEGKAKEEQQQRELNHIVISTPYDCWMYCTIYDTSSVPSYFNW